MKKSNEYSQKFIHFRVNFGVVCRKKTYYIVIGLTFFIHICIISTLLVIHFYDFYVDKSDFYISTLDFLQFYIKYFYASSSILPISH